MSAGDVAIKECRETLIQERKDYANKMSRDKTHLEQLQNRIKATQVLIDYVDSRLRELKNPLLHVSNHAIVRYLERIDGVDVEAVKDKILSDELLKQTAVLGDGRYPLACGKQAVIKNGVIVTIY